MGTKNTGWGVTSGFGGDVVEEIASWRQSAFTRR